MPLLVIIQLTYCPVEQRHAQCWTVSSYQAFSSHMAVRPPGPGPHRLNSSADNSTYQSLAAAYGLLLIWELILELFSSFTSKSR